MVKQEAPTPTKEYGLLLMDLPSISNLTSSFPIVFWIFWIFPLLRPLFLCPFFALHSFVSFLHSVFYSTS
ncbi:hypothetical protein B0H14DRAFT_2767791 [Mycena olivaceomarginata]|nr:hypothetical protein B0H14DRAFT_2767791 [Mycena olivaceomarginata]